MAHVFPDIGARPRELSARIRELSHRAGHVWSEARPRTRTAIQLGALIAVTVIAYSYSFTTLLQLADLNTPLAYVSLVPVIALILAAVNSRPTRPEPSIHDRQTDYIIGLPLMAAAVCVNRFLPAKLSAMFWVWRIDLLTLPFFVAGAVAVIFGVRVLWRQKVAIAFLFLAWPYPYTSVLLSVLNAFTNVTLAAMIRIVEFTHIARPAGGADNSIFTVVHAGHPFNLSVISACSGVSSVVGFLLVGVAFLAVIRGPWIRKVLWLAGGMVLLWAINLGRLTLVFWAGRQFGEHFAINVLHPYIGLVTFTIGVGIMILCIRPLGLRISNFERIRSAGGKGAQGLGHGDGGGPRKPAPVPKVYLAIAVVLVIAIFVGFSNVSLQNYNLVADVSGSPKAVSFIDDPVTPTGWTSRYEATFNWAAPLFGEHSVWNRYILSPGVGGDLRAHTQVVADVIDTPDLQSFAAFGVEQCYQFHGYSLAKVAQVQLSGGVEGQTLAYTSQQFGSWSIVYWILPVKHAGTTVYERVVLYVQNRNGVVTEPGTNTLVTNGSNVHQNVDVQNRDFLVSFAGEMIQNQADRGAVLLAGNPTR